MGGVGRFFGGVALALAFLLVFGYVVGVTALDAARPIIEREYPTTLYERTDACDPACGSVAAMDGFHVVDGMNEVHFVVYALLEAHSGPARVSVVDPSGDLRYDRVFTGAQALREVQDEAIWSAEIGEWRLARSYALTAGTLDYEAWGEGVPAGSFGEGPPFSAEKHPRVS